MSKQRLLFLAILLVASTSSSRSQSLELMAGHRQVFADVQWLKFLDESYRWSLFSRTRATVDYDQQTDLFSGAYLNYSLKSGLGVSLVGKIADAGAGADAGVHIFKAKEKWMLFGLASAGLKSELEYSWFSICRFTPPLNDRWKWYTSLELFTLFNKPGHAFSVQRLRLGLDRAGYQFGLAANLSAAGTTFFTQTNFGIFIRKSF